MRKSIGFAFLIVGIAVTSLGTLVTYLSIMTTIVLDLRYSGELGNMDAFQMSMMALEVGFICLIPIAIGLGMTRFGGHLMED